MGNKSWKGVLCLGLLVLLASTTVYSQNKRNPYSRRGTPGDKFLDKQFWVGVRAGGSLTKAKPVERYSAFVSTNDPSSNQYDKQYKNFATPGTHAALEVTFFYKDFGISFQPGYRTVSFEYENNYSWEDPGNSSNTIEQEYRALQKLSYFEFPLLFRYQPIKAIVRPYVQAGWYYSTLSSAIKETQVTTTDNASGGSGTTQEDQISVGADDLFIQSNMGWIVGVGGSFPIGNARLSAEINYRRNTHNITNVANRYSNDRLTGSGDILDDVKLRSLTLTFSVVIPLRFTVLKENYKVE